MQTAMEMPQYNSTELYSMEPSITPREQYEEKSLPTVFQTQRNVTPNSISPNFKPCQISPQESA